MSIFGRRRDRGIVQDGTAGLPPAGADRALYGTVTEMPYLERAARGKAVRTLRRAERRRAARLAVRRFRMRVRESIRPGLVLVLDVAGVCGLVYAFWLIWVPLAWALASATALALAWLLDAPKAPPGSE